MFAGQCLHPTNMRRRRLGQNLFIVIIIKKNNTYRLGLHNFTFVKKKISDWPRLWVEGLRVEGVVGRGVVGCGGRGGYEGNRDKAQKKAEVGQIAHNSHKGLHPGPAPDVSN